MAHVLLPCDLPSWNDVQKLLLRVRGSCREGGAKVAHVMAMVHEASSVSLDPDDSGPVLGHPGFERLAAFLNEEKTGNVLADIAEWASKLPALKPTNGIHYSLRTQESTLTLERSFVASLLANAFFSTFPRRKVKTHPTLQDFGMADFFNYLDRDLHQKRLKGFLRYFESLEPEPDGTIQFTRKVFHGPTLPGWLCSERPLVPLVVRPQGSIDEAEPWAFRGCPCAPSVGGDALTESTSQESGLFFECPELMVVLCFLESLVEEEALIVEGVRAPNTQDVNFCFLDSETDREGPMDDGSLLGALNKAVAAFAHEPRFVDRRRTPDGGESSSGGSRRSSQSREGRTQTASEKLRRLECYPKMLSARKPLDKSISEASSKFSMRTASESSARLDEEYYTADEESESESAASNRSPETDNRSQAEELHSPRRQSSSSPASLRSFGFVLGGNNSEDEDYGNNRTSHERLEDFRRRIRRRTRRKLSSSRRTSSSYSSGASSGSDMEDISEDPDECATRPAVVIRPACSEPSLVAVADSAADMMSPWVSPEVMPSLSGGQKQLSAATCLGTGGHPKAYSHDGVRPNLPVPFRARFRTKRRETSESLESEERSHSVSGTEDKEWMTSRCPVAVSASGEDPQLRALVLWLAGSMAQLPALILYTMNDPALREVIPVYKQVLRRQWTVGDLACEVLRFCRNQNTPGHRTGKHTHLFAQLMADRNIAEEKAARKIFKEESLD